jgi:hypothetical protein
MKKIKTFIITALLMLATTAFANQVMYHYCFVTTCGITECRSYSVELSDKHQLDMWDSIEASNCPQ